MTPVNYNNRICPWEKEYAAKLDAKDGKVDRKIQSSVWNEYAKEFGAPQIQNFIKLENALNTIHKYGCDLPEEEIETSEEVKALPPVVTSEPPTIVYYDYQAPVIQPDTITMVVKDEDEFCKTFIENLKFSYEAVEQGLDSRAIIQLTMDPNNYGDNQYNVKMIKSPSESFSNAVKDAFKNLPQPAVFFKPVKVKNGEPQEVVSYNKDYVPQKNIYNIPIRFTKP